MLDGVILSPIRQTDMLTYNVMSRNVKDLGDGT